MNFLKKAVMVLALFAAVPVMAKAHSVSLGFTKSTDDTGATGQGYTAWRSTGSCPASVTSTTGFTSLNTTLFTGATFTDSTVTPGTYCYIVTFTASSASSVPSNAVAATILPAAPTSVTVTSSN
jgi:hypothetical protein